MIENHRQQSYVRVHRGETSAEKEGRVVAWARATTAKIIKKVLWQRQYTPSRRIESEPTPLINLFLPQKRQKMMRWKGFSLRTRASSIATDTFGGGLYRAARKLSPSVDVLACNEKNRTLAIYSSSGVCSSSREVHNREFLRSTSNPRYARQESNRLYSESILQCDLICSEMHQPTRRLRARFCLERMQPARAIASGWITQPYNHNPRI